MLPARIATLASQDHVLVIVRSAVAAGDQMLERERMLRIEQVPAPVTAIPVPRDEPDELVLTAAIH
jgi:hypothetical protein